MVSAASLVVVADAICFAKLDIIYHAAFGVGIQQRMVDDELATVLDAITACKGNIKQKAGPLESIPGCKNRVGAGLANEHGINFSPGTFCGKTED